MIILYILYTVKINIYRSIFHVSVDYLMGIDKKKTIDVSDLSDEDISVLNHMADTLRKKNKDKKV